MGYGQYSKNNNNKNILDNGYGAYAESIRNKDKPKDPNPYQEGTPEYVNWEGANKTYKSNKNKIYGGNKSAQEGYAAYYDNKAGDFREGSLKDFNEKERGHVIGNRKKVINYMYDNNISSLEDWNNHEIKDKDVKWLWEKNLDISQYRNDFIMCSLIYNG